MGAHWSGLGLKAANLSPTPSQDLMVAEVSMNGGPRDQAPVWAA